MLLTNKGFRIYRNLHTGGYSVQGYIKSKGWRVVNQIPKEYSLVCKDVFFKVYEAGRQRVLDTKKKNVHAYLICRNYTPILFPVIANTTITYNPYKGSNFVKITQDKQVSNLTEDIRIPKVWITNTTISYNE